jgi:hypothetical protein
VGEIFLVIYVFQILKKFSGIFIVISCFLNDARASSPVSEVSGEHIWPSGSIPKIKNKLKIKPTGTLVNRSNELIIEGELIIERGTNSDIEDKASGAFHNHATIKVQNGGKITGNGKIYNYSSFIIDDPNTEKAELAIEESGYQSRSYDYSELDSSQMTYPPLIMISLTLRLPIKLQ